MKMARDYIASELGLLIPGVHPSLLLAVPRTIHEWDHLPSLHLIDA